METNFWWSLLDKIEMFLPFPWKWLFENDKKLRKAFLLSESSWDGKQDEDEEDEVKKVQDWQEDYRESNGFDQIFCHQFKLDQRWRVKTIRKERWWRAKGTRMKIFAFAWQMSLLSSLILLILLFSTLLSSSYYHSFSFLFPFFPWILNFCPFFFSFFIFHHFSNIQLK